MFSKVEVNGDGACDLYQFLTAEKPKDDGTPEVVWNFTKFLVGRDGSVLRRYEPTLTPEQIEADLADLLS